MEPLPRSTSDRFAYTPVPAPAVTNVSPSSGPDIGGDTVTITGSGFTNAYEVDFGGIAATFAVNDDTSITAYTPGGVDGTVDVTVTSAGGTSATTSADQYTYLAEPTPDVTGVSPSSGPDIGGDTVTITGSGFTNVYEVDFGGVAATFAVNDDTSITAYTPGGVDGTVDVTVISAGGTSATTSADQYTYVP